MARFPVQLVVRFHSLNPRRKAFSWNLATRRPILLISSYGQKCVKTYRLVFRGWQAKPSYSSLVLFKTSIGVFAGDVVWRPMCGAWFSRLRFTSFRAPAAEKMGPEREKVEKVDGSGFFERFFFMFCSFQDLHDLGLWKMSLNRRLF